MIYYQEKENMIVFSGELLFSNASSLLTEWELLQERSFDSLVLDCSHVLKADSSFIALLIEMRCWAHKQNKSFHLKKLPTFLQNFITVYGLDEMLMSPVLDHV